MIFARTVTIYVSRCNFCGRTKLPLRCTDGGISATPDLPKNPAQRYGQELAFRFCAKPQSFLLFELECAGVEAIICALFGYELFVVSALDYSAVVEHRMHNDEFGR